MRTTALVAVLGTLAVTVGAPHLAARRASPTVLMIHGGDLTTPVFVINRDMDAVEKFKSLWCGTSQRFELRQAANRPFYSVSSFWGLYPLPDEAGMASLLKSLKPEHAHQQGRLYASSGGVGAAAVSTDYMEYDRTSSAPRDLLIRPIATDATGFKYGTWLPEADVAAVEKLGLRLRR